MSKTKLSREEELLLQGFSSNVSKKGSFIFYTVAAFVSATPIYLYYGIHQMEATEAWMFWLVAVAASTFLLGTAYSNTKQNLKHQIIVKRGEAIAREVSKELADDKKISKLEKDERILWKKSEVGDYEATAFSFFYNNAIFHATFLVLSFFILASFSPALNCVFALVGASGLAALFSTSK
uniref:Translocon-associated protein subunit gamma n=1 Tax=Panagrolaimus sp. ES5 TaxID=591445 RepID=A0AC34GRU6_9BILA